MIVAFDHPFLSGLIGDPDIAAALALPSEIAAMVAFESALADAEAELGLIPRDAARRIMDRLTGFKPDIDRLRDGVARDGVVAPELVRQMRAAIGEPEGQFVHFGATSQDVIDTAFILRVRTCLDVLGARIASLLSVLTELRDRFGSRAMMGRTRMQAAIPIEVNDRLTTWIGPLERLHERTGELRSHVLAVQFGGAAGSLDRFGDAGPALRARLADRLGLSDAPQWHAQRDRMAALADWLSLLTGSLGKFGQDVALMALAGDEISLAGGGGSSAMAHKQNPVDAEVLVALARFNAGQLSLMHHSLVHEQERSGAAWTLEWLVLPQMLLAAGAATRMAQRLALNITSLGRTSQPPTD